MHSYYKMSSVRGLDMVFFGDSTVPNQITIYLNWRNRCVSMILNWACRNEACTYELFILFKYLNIYLIEAYALDSPSCGT